LELALTSNGYLTDACFKQAKDTCKEYLEEKSFHPKQKTASNTNLNRETTISFSCANEKFGCEGGVKWVFKFPNNGGDGDFEIKKDCTKMCKSLQNIVQQCLVDVGYVCKFCQKRFASRIWSHLHEGHIDKIMEQMEEEDEDEDGENEDEDEEDENEAEDDENEDEDED